MSEDIANNYQEINARIAAAAQQAGREAQDITLVAVSKKQPASRIKTLLASGHRVFGENRVQEAQEHWPQEMRAAYPDLRLHLIGPLQTNKVKDAVALFDVIETLDRPKLAEKLAHEMEKQGRDLPCYIQVNTGEEPQKAGVLPEELEDFYDMARGELGLDVCGLMCIPPIDAPAGLHFGLLQNWAERLGMSTLSMGMSADFDKAIRHGATHIRVGSALFGAREKQ